MKNQERMDNAEVILSDLNALATATSFCVNSFMETAEGRETITSLVFQIEEKANALVKAVGQIEITEE